MGDWSKKPLSGSRMINPKVRLEFHGCNHHLRTLVFLAFLRV